MDSTAVITLASFLALQTGALVYWAGSVTETLRHMTEELTETKAMALKASNDLAYIKGQRGLEL
jgi:hypothetical protein